ncbi:MAG TPA: hypothetical protein VFB24_06045 [Candidatus Binatia bacterium]|nr:hypothetical protein [Candidatus Binatia bacterium]
MATAYSEDLRRKLLGAHDRGEGSLRQLAQRFWGAGSLGVEDIPAAEADAPDGTDQTASQAAQPHHGGGAREARAAGQATTPTRRW